MPALSLRKVARWLGPILERRWKDKEPYKPFPTGEQS